MKITFSSEVQFRIIHGEGANELFYIRIGIGKKKNVFIWLYISVVWVEWVGSLLSISKSKIHLKKGL